MNYYNEIDPHAAQWLRNLIGAGVLPPGDVDERSIEDVRPNDLRGYVQCHFFAGIGGWVHALDLAGWPPDRPVWTGSCPCQPFSSAGKGNGFADERHLWPSWQHLIAQCRPPVVFGEQVASKAAGAWIDLVHADMEGVGYTFGCASFPVASIRAPHGRHRIMWVADTNGTGFDRQPERYQQSQTRQQASFRGDANGRGLSPWDAALELEGADGARRLLAPGVQLLADGLSDGMVALRALGNAIVPQHAAEFICAYLETQAVAVAEAA